jgi:hypothetical protein
MRPLSQFEFEIPGANPIKIITPTPKFWSWCNYEKSLFQSYKTTLVLTITPKRHFFGVNYGVISTPKFVRRKLRQKMTLLRRNQFYRIESCFRGLTKFD